MAVQRGSIWNRGSSILIRTDHYKSDAQLKEKKKKKGVGSLPRQLILRPDEDPAAQTNLLLISH